MINTSSSHLNSSLAAATQYLPCWLNDFPLGQGAERLRSESKPRKPESQQGEQKL